MANFQTQILDGQARGVQGDKAGLNHHVYTVGNVLAEGLVTVGTFVWDGSQPGLAKNSGTGKPLGFVERVLAYYNLDLNSPATLKVPDRTNLTVARKGDYYAVALTAATRGQKVFAVLADGTLKTGAAGATISGAVETDWTVIDAGAAGELITISNWS